jgi:hypothetical protein
MTASAGANPEISAEDQRETDAGTLIQSKQHAAGAPAG